MKELVKLAYLPAMPCTEKTRELVSQIEEAARLEGVKIGWVDAGGGSDANHIALAGTPVIDGVGPAGAGFHTDREYLIPIPAAATFSAAAVFIYACA